MKIYVMNYIGIYGLYNKDFLLDFKWVGCCCKMWRVLKYIKCYSECEY